MAFSFINKKVAVSSGGGSFTSSATDMTGADFLVAVLSSLSGAHAPTDSLSNTWVPLTVNDDWTNYAQIFYVANATVGSAQTFSVTSSSNFAVLVVYGFSGGKLSGPFDVENQASATATSLATGSVTPSEDNELIIAGISFELPFTTASINSGFSTPDQSDYSGGNHYGGAASYLIQTSAGAVNPTFSWTDSGLAHAVIATFKAAAGGGGAGGPLVGGSLIRGSLIRGGRLVA